MSEASDFYGYVQVPVDIDLGVTIRTVGASQVIMYKARPGLYLNPKGGEVDDEMARKAGFPVDAHRAAMKVQAKIREATQEVLRKQAVAEAEVRKGLPPEVLAQLPPMSAVADVSGPPEVAITERTKDGKPRGTKDFVIAYSGKDWTVYGRNSRKPVEEGFSEEEAIEYMVEAQREVDEAGS